MVQVPAQVEGHDLLDEEVDEPVPFEQADPPDESLAERARKRREALQRERTTVLEIPAYEGVVAVEYRILGYQLIRKLALMHARERDAGLRELYICADQLIRACENTYELRDDHPKIDVEGCNLHGRPLGLRYGVELAQALGITTLSPGATARQALLAIFDVDSRVVAHHAEYMAWTSGERVGLEQEVERDF